MLLACFLVVALVVLPMCGTIDIILWFLTGLQVPSWTIGVQSIMLGLLSGVLLRIITNAYKDSAKR